MPGQAPHGAPASIAFATFNWPAPARPTGWGHGRSPRPDSRREAGAVRFADRDDAGRLLAARLEHLRGHDVVVLGLPRGGVPVAAVVARSLHAPLDVIIVRKLGVPSQPELGMGAVGEEGTIVVNLDIVRRAGVTAEEMAEV